MNRFVRQLSVTGGFTLTELALVVAILGTIASIAVPRVTESITKAQEASVKGKLGALRSALGIYYANTVGDYPTDLEAGLEGDYIDAVPALYIPPVSKTGNPGHLSDDIIDTDQLIDTDSGAWEYFTNDGTLAVGQSVVKKGKGKKKGWLRKGGPRMKYINVTPYGNLFIDCTHEDTVGNVWSTY